MLVHPEIRDKSGLGYQVYKGWVIKTRSSRLSGLLINLVIYTAAEQ